MGSRQARVSRARYTGTTADAPIGNKDVIVPLVVLGHVKRMYNCDNICFILQEINRFFGVRLCIGH